MIEFRLLGSLELRGPGGEEILSVLSQPKRTALLAYLAVAAPRGFHRRDEILGVFWPESDQEHARAALRKSLHFLRRSLGEDAILGRGDEEVALDWGQITCDAAELDAALEAGDVEKALELYRGDLLPGFFLSGCPSFEKWLDGERERLRKSVAAAAWEVAYQRVQSGRASEGEDLAQWALALVGPDENEARRFMQALAAAGDRAAAVRFYERFARGLAEELDLRPAPETRALAEALRSTRGGLGTEPPPAATLRITREGPGTGPPPAEAEAGDLLDRVRRALADRYAVKEDIGRGAMATVFLAEDLKHGRRVAIKVLAPELAEALGAARFLREIEIVANLAHPHILPLHDSGEAGGLLYYVMPFVEGESLESRLKREGQLPVEDALLMAREIADALAFAHGRGIVHRDVKPGNILMEAGHAVLADFGIAHAVAMARPDRHGSKPWSTGTLRSEGGSLGTPAYMSPEQVAGDRDPDGRSDQYGLACVLYEMLAGQPLFTGRDGESVARQHLTREPVPVTDFRPLVPQSVSEALLRALSKLPADRFNSMEAFSRELSPPGQELSSASASYPADAESKARESAAAASPTPGGTRRERFRRRWFLGGLGLGAAIAAVLLLLRPAPDPGVVTEPAPVGQTVVVVVAVMPVTVQGSEELSWLGEGIAVLLATRLDDVGGVRSVDRNALIPYVQKVTGGRRLSLADAREAARRLGASHFVMSDAVASGGGRLTLAATVYTLDGEPSEPSEVFAEGSVEEPSSLVDSMARQLIGVLNVSAGQRLSAVAALTTDDASALKAFVEGERAFRATRYEEAFQAFQRAVEVDSSFALAYYRQSVAAMLGLRFNEAHLAADRAQRNAERLTTRYRRLLRAWAALIEGSADEAERQYAGIRLEYPDEVEAHFGLAEVLSYYNPVRGRSPSEAGPALEEVLEISPGFGQARFHLLELATQRGDRIAFDSLVAGVDPSSDQALAWQAVRAFAWGTAEDQAGIEARVRVADDVGGGLAVARVAGVLQDHRAAERLASLMAGPDRSPETRGAAMILAAMMRLAQGRWTEGMEGLEEAHPLAPAWALELKALYTGLPFRPATPEELRAVRDELGAWRADQVGLSTNFVLFAHNGFHPYLRLYLLALTNLRLGELDEARRYANELQTAPHSVQMTAISAAWARSIRVRVAAAEGRGGEAAGSLESARAEVPLELIAISPFFSRSVDRYVLGGLLEELGRPDQALDWYGSLTEGYELVLVAPAHFQMAQILESQGEVAAAAQHYSRFAELWRDCDAALRPTVEEALEKASRLGGIS